MTQEQLERKITSLKKEVERKGYSLTINEKYIDKDRLDCIWYGGPLATIKISDEITISIDVYGDVYATLYDENNEYVTHVKDKRNNGNFYCVMESYIKNDDQLQEYIDNGRILLDYNNWVEVSAWRNGSFIDLGYVCDENNILNAIQEVIDIIDNIIEDIENY